MQGRAKDGGLRVGDMEFGALLAHGASSVFRERMLTSSDGVVVSFCDVCGTQAIKTQMQTRCALSGCSGVSFHETLMPYTTTLLTGRLGSAGIELRS